MGGRGGSMSGGGSSGKSVSREERSRRAYMSMEKGTYQVQMQQTDEAIRILNAKGDSNRVKQATEIKALYKKAGPQGNPHIPSRNEFLNLTDRQVSYIKFRLNSIIKVNKEYAAAKKNGTLAEYIKG